MKPLVNIIPDKLWQAGQPVSLDEVYETGINVIINVGQVRQEWITAWEKAIWQEVLDKADSYTMSAKQAIHLHIPLLDAPNMLDPVACEVAVEATTRLLNNDEERRALVHCEAGAFRSVHVTAAIYAHMTGCCGHKAFEHIDSCRGMTNPRAHLMLPGWAEHITKFGGGKEW